MIQLPNSLKCLLLLYLSIIGCTARGYDGPRIDSALISNIAVHSTQEVNLKTVIINERNLGSFDTSIDVTKGEHTFSISYESEKTATCYSEYRQCSVRVSVGTCTGKIKTLEGRKYLITLSAKSGDTTMSILPKGYYDFTSRNDETNIGSGICKESSFYFITRADRS
jgi:hypothetical protein